MLVPSSFAERPLDDREIAYMLRLFFRGKKDKNGSILKNSDISLKRHIDIVRLIGLKDAVDIFYMSLQENRYRGYDKWSDGRPPKSFSSFFIKVQKKCYALRIPKHYCGGFAIVYLILCERYVI